MSTSSEPLIIEGNFKPNRLTRFFSHAGRVGLALLGLVVVVALSLYSLTVYYQSKINEVSGQARDVNEENRELEVELSRIRSFKNIEAAAAQAPQLRLPEEILEIKVTGKHTLPVPPPQQQEVPRVYGY